MRLEYIKVKNFGIHESEEVHLTDGLVVVRGKNYAGKSTLAIQAPVYAFFGTPSLEATIQDTVTRGKTEKDLHVEIKYGPYVVKRSKASASVIGGGIKISGQAEVSNFFYDLFGVAKGAETMVIVSEQDQTAGILRGKPGEVNSFIETLAGFDQIDGLIERVKDKFPSGMKSAYEDRLLTLEARLEELNEQSFEDIPPLEADLQMTKALLIGRSTVLTNTQKELEEKNKDLLAATTNNAEVKALDVKLDTLTKSIETNKVRQEELTKEIGEIPKTKSEELEEANKFLSQLDELNRNWQAYEWVSGIGYDGPTWEGNFDSFETELTKTAATVREKTADVKKLESEIYSKKSQIVTDENCKACGQDVTKIHKEVNSRINSEIKKLTLELTEIKRGLGEDIEYLDALNTINVEQLKRNRCRFKDVLEINSEEVPYIYTYSGVAKKPDAKAVSEANKVVSEAQKNKARLGWCNDEIEKLENSTIKLERQYNDLHIERGFKDFLSTDAIEAAIKVVKKNVEGLVKEKESLQKEEVDKVAKIALGKSAVENHNKQLIQTKEDISSTKQLLVTDARNGKIVKAVRDAKPKVLELVWTKILFSVSKTFSDMVGYDAGVEKDAKGFRINGLPVARLSGSEKTVLGIALRATLRDVFAPGAGVMFWDEPFDGCTMETAANAAAIIAAIPGQKIVVTHDAELEMMADQFVEV